MANIKPLPPDGLNYVTVSGGSTYVFNYIYTFIDLFVTTSINSFVTNANIIPNIKRDIMPPVIVE